MADTTMFTMPSLGADMDSGTLLEWLVKPGDTVHKGDIVAVVDTTKAAVEVETFDDGVVDQLLVEPGTEVPVGTPLASIAVAREPAAARVSAETKPRSGSMSPVVRRLARDLGVDLADVSGSGRSGSVTKADVLRAARAPDEPRVPVQAKAQRATPYARRLAAELGVDLASLPANGPIHADDVRRAASPSQPSQPSQPTQPSQPSRAAEMRTTIARVMARSKREIPHYYLSTTVDLSRAIAWLTARNAELPVTERLVPAVLLLKATALAAARHGELNGFWQDDELRPGTGVHLGVAISLRGGGLVAPAIRDADHLEIPALMGALRDLVTRARAGRLRGSELADPTLTVTNLGDQGVESVLGVIYPPQVALVGFGRVAERPVAVDGLIGARPTTVLTLSADHRATDGFTGARFVDDIDKLLQRPEEL